MTDGRWDRLAADLTAAGLDATIDAKPYQEIYLGRVRSGVTRSITFQLPGKGLVTVSDAWWSKNPEIWLGWEVTAEDTGSIVQGRPAHSKKRGETVAAVRTAIARLRNA
jgi:hypothetical protein